MKSIIRPAGQTPQAAKAEDAFRAGNLCETQEFARKAIAADPSSEHGYYWLARASLGLDDYASGVEASRKALELCPDEETLLLLHGDLLRHSDRLAEALDVYKRCVDLHSKSVLGWTAYSIVLQNFSRYEESRLAALMALSLAPDYVTALLSYCKALKETGEPELAITAARRAVELAPDQRSPRELLVFLLLLGEHATAPELRKESEEVARLIANRRKPVQPVKAREPRGRIRLGVLSNDIHRHACAYFLIPLIANLDRSRVEVVVIALNAYRDHVSEKIAGLADRFVDVAGMSETAVVEAVRTEGLDALIDLGGYTGVSPLTYMAYGLAPVQLTWLGFPGGTGMKEIHYRISDAVADPEGFDSHYVETLLRAPGTFCTYAPLMQHPLQAYGPGYQVAPTPALRNGFITFGSCNNFGKLTERVLRLWQSVLARVPGSKLLVEAAGLELPPVRADLIARMAKVGIAKDRLILVPRDPRRQYLTYHDIDVVLDAFPLTGGTTTCDALWMGVPIVTLAGQAFHSRMSGTFLGAVGLEWLVCQDEAAYVEAVAQLAADVEQLNALRLSIRPRFERSSTFDSDGFARWLEDHLIRLVGQHRPLGAMPRGNTAGIDYQGKWLSEPALGQRIAALLTQGDTQADGELTRLLERMSAKWSKHWMVAYALAEQARREGNHEGELELLMIAIELFPTHLPLYRLLAARMDTAGLERGWIDELVQGQFGVPLSQAAAPGVADILNLQHIAEAA